MHLKRANVVLLVVSYGVGPLEFAEVFEALLDQVTTLDTADHHSGLGVLCSKRDNSFSRRARNSSNFEL
jgi:hypothetical protein